MGLSGRRRRSNAPTEEKAMMKNPKAVMMGASFQSYELGSRTGKTTRTDSSPDVTTTSCVHATDEDALRDDINPDFVGWRTPYPEASTTGTGGPVAWCLEPQTTSDR